MKEKDLYSEINSIRTLMERSTKFISLSGLSGVMAGLYALIGAGFAYKLIYVDYESYEYTRSCDAGIYLSAEFHYSFLVKLLLLAAIVFILTISTVGWLTMRKAKSQGSIVWNSTAKLFLVSGIVPLVTGGLFLLILLSQGYIGIMAPACLIFYGLALFAAGNFTYGDIKWLGISEIALGLIATIYPGYGLFFWAAGFGVLHIIYGSVMHFKYDRENSTN